MSYLVAILISLLTGFVAGLLVGRKHSKELQAAIDELGRLRDRG